jgi:hypothetical protein
VKKSRLTNEEVPILRRINEKTRTRHSAEQMSKDSTGGSVKLSPKDPSIGFSTQMDDIDKTLSDNEIFGEYSDVILRSFPFMSLLEDIKNLLDEAGIKRLVVFFDDFSELDWVDQSYSSMLFSLR